MGAVWLAERADGSLKRQVALKLPRASWSVGLAQRMARERDILASLEHPNIARLYDAGTDAQGRPFLALEYVEGQPIDLYCRERALNIKTRLKLLQQVARAVAFAHSRLVVHRDLKPSNILVMADGQVRLLDFGIAKLLEGDRTQETQLTRLAGQALTLDYASPEQIRGEQIGTASDVYSLGVVMYELLAGVKPYRLKRQSAAQLEEAIAVVDAPLASATTADAAAKRELKGDLDAILNKALKKSPNERYATVDALALDIEHHLAGRRVEARPDSLRYRITRFARRYRIPLIAGAITLAVFALAIGVGATVLLALVLAAGLGVALWQARAAMRRRDEALRALERQQQVQLFLNTLLTEAARGGESFTGRQLFQRCEALVEKEFGGSGHVPAAVLSMIGQTMTVLGEAGEALRLNQLAVSAARDSDDAMLQDMVQFGWAMAIGWNGRVAEARAALSALLERKTLIWEQRAEVHNGIASLAEIQRDLPAALEHARQALACLRRAKRPSRKLEASLLGGLAGACSLNGLMAESERHFSAAFAILESLGQADSVLAQNALNNWSTANDRAGDARRALELIERALAITAPGTPRSPFLVFNRGRELDLLGRWDDAEASLREALQLSQEAGASVVTQHAAAALAWLALERGDYPKARTWLAEFYANGGDEEQVLLAKQVQGRLTLHAGDFAAAIRSATSVIESNRPSAGTIYALLLRAEAQRGSGRLDSALDDAHAAVALAKRLQADKRDSARTGIAELALARLLVQAGSLSDGRRAAVDALAMLERSVDASHPAIEEARGLATYQLAADRH
jgi:serine/threonine-protein kinase